MDHISQIIDSLTEQNEDMHDAMHDEFYESRCTTCGHPVAQCTCGTLVTEDNADDLHQQWLG